VLARHRCGIGNFSDDKISSLAGEVPLRVLGGMWGKFMSPPIRSSSPCSRLMYPPSRKLPGRNVHAEKTVGITIENPGKSPGKKQGKPLKYSGNYPVRKKTVSHFFVLAVPAFFFPVAFPVFFCSTAFTSQGKHFSSRSSMIR